nr:helix-hairpin-helix domain-containing protein [Lacticaseibacillus nasuensis]
MEGLSGIGPKRAADIVAYRDAHGGFKTVEELKEVSGIGEKIFASLAPNVTVGP